MCWAREANIKAISARGERPSVAESSRTRRIFSPVAVPPGSRVSTTLCPAARKTAASLRICVLLPVPSSPSKVMNFPRRNIIEMIAAEPRLCTAPPAGCYSLEFRRRSGISIHRHYEGLKHETLKNLGSSLCSLRLAFQLVSHAADRNHLCRCHLRSPQNLPRQAEDPRQPRRPDSVLSEVDSRRARP